MNDARIGGAAAPASALSAGPRPGATAGQAASMARDRLALGRRAGQPTHFHWGAAFGHFWHGMRQELVNMVLAPFQHPFATLLMLGLSAGALLLAPMLGISAVAVGNAMLVGFGVLALARTARGALQAFGDYRRHDYATAEQDFEAIGAGSADALATFGPGAVGKGFAIVRRTEAGQALGTVVSQSKIGRAIVAGEQGVKGFARTSIWGKLRAAPGQGGKLETLGNAARRLTARLRASDRLRFTVARLDQWRLQIAQSGTVRGFNRAFDTLPREFFDRFEGRAITYLNYSKTGQAVRDWGLAKAAAQKGQSLAELKAAMATRLKIPPVRERASSVSPTLERGSVPQSAQDFEYLIKQKHVKTIVSLLHPDNPNEVGLLATERQLAARYGVKFIDLPLPFGVDPPPSMVQRFLQTVDAATPDARVYVHCRLGRDRTGTMVALYRQVRQGWSGQQALAEMEKFGYDPQRDTYLAYLGNYVLNVAKSGVNGVKKVLLDGSLGDVWRALRGLFVGTATVTRTPVSARKD